MSAAVILKLTAPLSTPRRAQQHAPQALWLPLPKKPINE
jgi:hypothetical protein